VASRLEVLELRKRSRVYQKLTVPQIVRKVLEEGGYPASSIEERLGDEHAAREYVVQYAESDAAFVRRMCEDDGLYFHFGVNEKGEVLVLADRSSGAAPALGEGAPPLALIDHDQPDALGSGLVAFGWRSVSRRRAGKITLRDYDHENPGLALVGVEAAGTPVEQGVEVYDAPGGFRDAGAGAARARLRLESLRADARTSVFQTTALALAPGLSFSVEPHARFTGAPPIAVEHVVTAVRHRWTAESVRNSIEVEAIPRDIPFRLPRVTPRPVIHGLQSAFVTGPDGEEIHPDHLGRIFVRFPWDLDGPRDDKSSLPVRVSQPNMPGSMVIPRVGWEVLVAFEDGDPDRPYVIGRTYNGKMRPPL